MKKQFKLALAVGAMSACLSGVAFAGANPFTDVPSDHWAYDAVAQLARDGVIEGYGDGTYRGDQEITRYEMAQMVARALVKKEVVPETDKSMIDRLAAEFADELNTLGVRVSKLEEKVDNVKFSGFFRYDYVTTNKNAVSKEDRKSRDVNKYRLRLVPEARVNHHWKVKGQIQYNSNTAAKTGEAIGAASLNQAYAQGKYGKTTLNLGRLPYTDMVTGGLVFDSNMSGADITTGKDVKLHLAAGRVAGSENTKDTVNYQSVELYTNPSNKFTVGVGYHNLASDKDSLKNGDDKAGILTAGLGLQMSPVFGLSAGYAKDTKADSAFKNEKKSSYSVQLNYKGSNKKKVGSYGLFAAYRQLGELSTMAPTYNIGGVNEKFWTVGGAYTFLPNAQIFLEYLDGKDTANNDKDFKTAFGRINFSF